MTYIKASAISKQNTLFRGPNPQKFKFWIYQTAFKHEWSKNITIINGSVLEFERFDEGSTVDQENFYYKKGLAVHFHIAPNLDKVVKINTVTSRYDFFEAVGLIMNTGKLTYRVSMTLLFAVEGLCLLFWSVRCVRFMSAVCCGRRPRDRDEIVFKQFVERRRVV